MTFLIVYVPFVKIIGVSVERESAGGLLMARG